MGKNLRSRDLKGGPSTTFDNLKSGAGEPGQQILMSEVELSSAKRIRNLRQILVGS